MANLPLTGNGISSSYQGLIKTSDNTALSATEKPLTDGLANALPMTAGTAGVSFTGGVDFTSATVTGLPDNNTTYDLAAAQNVSDVDVTLTGSDATVDTVKLVAGTNITLTAAAGNVTIDAAGGGGAAGLVSGTGTDSMQSDASLTTTAANASGACSIALGNNARANATTSIAIGCGWAFATDAISIGGGSVYRDGAIHIGASGKGDGLNGVAIGTGAIADGGSVGGDIAIGLNSCSKATSAISIGANSDAHGIKSIAIGDTSYATGQEDVIIGNAAVSELSNKGGTALGSNTCVDDGAVALGRNAQATGVHAIAIGGQCNLFSTTGGANATGIAAIAIGNGSTASASGSVALGNLVTAAKTNTVTVKELETCVAGGGITMKSPNGTEYKLTVSDAGALVIT